MGQVVRGFPVLVDFITIKDRRKDGSYGVGSEEDVESYDGLDCGAAFLGLSGSPGQSQLTELEMTRETYASSCGKPLGGTRLTFFGAAYIVV